MMRKSGGGGRTKHPDPIDEVEELLRVAHDDVLLDLNLNSHIKSKSTSKFESHFEFEPESSNNSSIDPDLDRRFQALRSKPSKPNPKPVADKHTTTTGDEEVDIDNLFARFSALKAPSTVPTTTNTSSSQDSQKAVEGTLTGGDAEEEDEVSKIIRWAIDAARLDPSPSSDIDDDDDGIENDDEDEDTDDDDDDDRVVDCKKKGSKK